MPVVTIYLNRIMPMLKGSVSVDQLVDNIPFLGLDLEEITDEYLRIEYNPNRPDYSTDYGLARGLNGLLGFEVGAPQYKIIVGDTEVRIKRSVKKIRPYIVGLVANHVQFDDESIRQIITMQEDLHNGVGRKRKKVSVGIHNSDVIKYPIIYGTCSQNFRFTPLGERRSFTIKQILEKMDVGIAYGGILMDFENYPLLTDSRGEVLSFPPIINGDLTKVTSKTKNIFIEITGTELKSVNNALSVFAATLHDLGARLETVKIVDDKSSVNTPNMKPYEFEVNVRLTNKLLGLNLSKAKIIESLSRSRIDSTLKDGRMVARVPSYRFDIMHQVDLVEEVAIGYGLSRFTLSLPESNRVGSLDKKLVTLDVVRNTLSGLGFIEVMNFSLLSRDTLYDKIGRSQSEVLQVNNPKAGSFEVLRDMLLPSLLETLSRNLHEEYPQRIFEVATVFNKEIDTITGIQEKYHVAVAMAHSQAGYTEAKSYLTSLLANAFGINSKTTPTTSPIFSQGRTAAVKYGANHIGTVGEVRPGVLENFHIKMPVAAFELSLDKLILSQTL